MSWNYPWTPNEDPDRINPATGKINRDDHEYYLWFQAMRQKYGYPRDGHVAEWKPRYSDWRRSRIAA